MLYPEPQNAPHVSKGINLLNSLQPCGVLSTTEMSALDREVTRKAKATDANPWYGVYW